MLAPRPPHPLQVLAGQATQGIRHIVWEPPDTRLGPKGSRVGSLHAPNFERQFVAKQLHIMRTEGKSKKEALPLCMPSPCAGDVFKCILLILNLPWNCPESVSVGELLYVRSLMPAYLLAVYAPSILHALQLQSLSSGHRGCTHERCSISLTSTP